MDIATLRECLPSIVGLAIIMAHIAASILAIFKLREVGKWRFVPISSVLTVLIPITTPALLRFWGSWLPAAMHSVFASLPIIAFLCFPFTIL
jgi:hypothetical protein